MGSFIELNDTLQLTADQGFPKELNYEQHKIKPFKLADFVDQVFEFKNKPRVRIFHMPPVRNFLVQNIDGKWLYWGLIHVTDVTHDYVKQTTSGKFTIIYLYTPDEMKHAHRLIDRNRATDYLQAI